MDLYKRLLAMVKPFWKRLALAMVCMTVVAAATAGIAWIVKPVLDDILIKQNRDALYFIPVAVIVMYALKGVCTYGQIVLMNFVGQRIVANLRNELYAHLQTLSLRYFDNHPTGDLMSRITNDVHRIQNAVSMAVTGAIKEPLTLILLIVVMLWRDWQFAVITFCVFPVAVFPVVRLGRRLRRIASKHQVTMGNISSLLKETISGHRIVKAFNMEDHENRRFVKESERLFELGMRNVRIKAIPSPLMEFLGGLAAAGVILYGGLRVMAGQMTVGGLFSFMAAMAMLYEPVKRLSGLNNAVQEGLASAERIYEVLDTEPLIKDKPGAVELTPISRSIEFRDVRFCYDTEEVLKGIDLEVKVGEIVALVGVSGGGKTTLVNLIPRFYEVSSGAVLIDGQDVRDVTLKSLRSQIGMVTQQTILFDDSVRHNIAYGDMAKSGDQIKAAAEAAYAHDFVTAFPEGYDTFIGESGVRLSGGERQRLSIARALLKDAPILILDEATSSLDTESELYVQKALANLMQGRTTLVIAHRLSTVRHADRIVVISGGRIVEEGRHEELLTMNGEYTKLYRMQFKVDRLTEAEVESSGATLGAVES